jgi:lipoprotein-releasing system permease protein
VGFSRNIAFRFLGSRRSTVVLLVSVLAVGGIALGVTVMNVTLAVMNGFRDEIQLLFVENMPMVTVLSWEQSALAGDTDELVRRIEAVDGVVAAAPYLRQPGILSSERPGSRARHQNAIIWAIDPDRQMRVTPLDRNISPEFHGFDSGQLVGDGRGLPGIIVGVELAASLRAGVGDVLSLTVPVGDMGRLQDLEAATADFAVVGVLDSGMYEFDNSFAYVALKSADLLFGREGAVDGIGVRVPEMMLAEKYGNEIAAALGPPYWTHDWISMNEQLFQYINMEKVMMFLLLLLMTMVSSFAIIAILTMIVRDRQYDIAVLRSFGTSRRQILFIFLHLGSVLGIVGTFLGTLLGLGLISYIHTVGIELPGEVYFVDSVPANVNARDVLLIAGVTILLSFLATVLPSAIATRFQPVEILRHE